MYDLLKLLPIICIGVLIASCNSSSDKILEDFKTVDNSLEKTNKKLDDTNSKLSEKAAPEVVSVIKPQADSLYLLIEDLKTKLRNISQKMDTNDEMDDLVSSNQLMIEQKNSDKLFTKVEAFQELCASKVKGEAIEGKINDLFSGYRQNKKIQETLFKNMPTVAALTLLSKFQNDVRQAENIVYQQNLKKLTDEL